MKGIIFTEFIEMVEEKFGFEVADKIITKSNLPSEGVYTAVGTYNFDEMVQLVSNLSAISGVVLSDLLFTFGDHLLDRFFSMYPHFFEGKKNTFEFLSNLEDYIHVEVLKLYTDAELPAIETLIEPDGNSMTLVYKSSRKMGDLALGLMNGCARHFGEEITVEKLSEGEKGAVVTFLLTKK